MSEGPKKPPRTPRVVTGEETRGRARDRTPDAQVKRELIHQGKIIRLDRDTVRFPDGREDTMEIARHSGASAVVPFMSEPTGEDPQVLLIRQYRYATDGYVYEIPAGRLEKDEDPKLCAARELKEETGCSAESVELLTTIFTTPGFTDEVIHIYMATGLTMGDHAREADEYVDVVIMRLAEALELVRSNEIVDAKTIIGLLYAAGFRT